MAALGAWGTILKQSNTHYFSGLHDPPTPDYVTSLGIILLLIKQMETSVLGLRQLREYVTAEISVESLDPDIAEGEVRIANVKRNLNAASGPHYCVG